MSKPEAILSDFVTRDEFASELDRSPRTLDRWEVLGIGPPRTLVGRKVLYRRASIRSWLAAQERHRSTDPHIPNSRRARARV
jgi:hypothetical protein